MSPSDGSPQPVSFLPGRPALRTLRVSASIHTNVYGPAVQQPGPELIHQPISSAAMARTCDLDTVVAEGRGELLHPPDWRQARGVTIMVTLWHVSDGAAASPELCVANSRLAANSNTHRFPPNPPCPLMARRVLSMMTLTCGTCRACWYAWRACPIRGVGAASGTGRRWC